VGVCVCVCEPVYAGVCVCVYVCLCVCVCVYVCRLGPRKASFKAVVNYSHTVIYHCLFRTEMKSKSSFLYLNLSKVKVSPSLRGEDTSFEAFTIPKRCVCYIHTYIHTYIHP